MSKVSVAAKNVLFEAFVMVFLFCSVSHCYKESTPHNEDRVHRVPLGSAACWDRRLGLCFAVTGKRFHLPASA